MKNLSIKLFSMLVIMLLCLSPLGAIDLNQGDNTPIINGTDTKNDNNIADVNDTINNNIKDNNSNVEIKSINETDNFKNKEEFKNLSLNDTNTSKNLTTLQDNAPGTFADLQTEINNAPAGSVLNLTRDYNGAENTVVKLDKDLTIDGNGHTIDCKNLENCEAFTSTSGTINLKNLKIINGRNDESSVLLGDYRGGAIIIKGSAQYTIENCYFENNYADDYGGAIYSTDSSNLKIIGCTFNSNKADDYEGGAIYSDSKSELEILNSKFTGNKAKLRGGAICAVYSLLKIKNSTFDSNRADSTADDNFGGAVYCYSDIEIESSKFISNYAGDYGGAIYAKGNVTVNANPDSPESIFLNNKAADKSAGAINADKGVKIFNSKFTGNTAKRNGGAIDAVAVRVNNCTFGSNRAEGSAYTCSGGAIRGEIVNVYSCDFNNNFAENDGGAIYAISVTIDNTVPSSFVSNTAKKDKGGAIYAHYLNENIKYLTLYDNSAAIDNSDDGGAIYLNEENHVTFSHCSIVSNHCGDEGGAIYLDSINSHISLINNIIIANRAGDEGHVVFNKGYYDAINNNWWGDINPSSDNGLLVEWKFFKSNIHHVDTDPLRSQLKIEDNPVGINETAVATYYFVKSDGSQFDGELEAPVSFILPENIIKESSGKTLNTVYIKFKANQTGTYTITANLHGQMISNKVTITDNQKPVAVINANNYIKRKGTS